MIHGVWVPFKFYDTYKMPHIIAQFSFPKVRASGVVFVVGEINDEQNNFNHNWQTLVQKAYDSDMPIVIGEIKIDIAKYYEKYHEMGFWSGDDFMADDPFYINLGYGIKNKEMHGLIVNFHNVEQKNGESLPDIWVHKIISVTMARIRKYAPSVNKRITGETIFPSIDSAIVEKNKYEAVGNYLYVYEKFACAMNDESTRRTIFSITWEYWKNIGEYLFAGVKPKTSSMQGWKLWRWMSPRILTENFSLDTGGMGIVGVCSFNGNKEEMIQLFRQAYKERVILPEQKEEPKALTKYVSSILPILKRRIEKNKVLIETLKKQ